MKNWKQWARLARRDAHALYFAARDPRVPWYAKAVAIAVAAYALSPIDLIPDFIPVVGYLDDLIIVPLRITLVVSMVPDDVMAEHRATATSAGEPNRSGGGHYRLDLVCRGLVLVRLGLSPIDIKLTHYPIEAAQSLAGRTVS